MQVTWSVSQDQILQTCERRYYFHYLCRPRINSRSSQLREIAYLKKLKSLVMWKGDIFHSLVAEYLRQIQQGMVVSQARLLESYVETIKQDWEYSSTRHYLNLANPREKGTVLFEHEYDESFGDITCESVIQTIIGWFENFVAWAKEIDLEASIQRSRRVWIEPPVFGPQAPGFMLDNVQVLAKVDLAFLTPNRKFEIFDWKTGIQSSVGAERLSHSEFQVSIYQLWPHLAFQIPLDNIQAHLVYVGMKPVHKDTFYMDQNAYEYTYGLARRSISRALRFIKSHKAREFDLSHFDFAAYAAACRKCPFKRLCQRELEA